MKKKSQKGSDDFRHRKLTLRVRFWHFLTACHYSNSPNLVISFDYSWFLAKNLSNFVSLPWKLLNRYCHNWRTSANWSHGSLKWKYAGRYGRHAGFWNFMSRLQFNSGNLRCLDLSNIRLNQQSYSILN